MIGVLGRLGAGEGGSRSMDNALENAFPACAVAADYFGG